MPDTISTLVILGAGGDLAQRLLLPGVGQLLDVGDRGTGFTLIGVGQDPMTDAAWRERVTASFATGGATSAAALAVVANTRYLQADVTVAADLERVFAACTGTPALYFALPPRITIKACTALGSVTIPPGTVLALEKPFGTDQGSAHALNEQLARLVPEPQIHRVDHFLGKSTVLNLLGLRFANRIFERVWNRDDIEKVEIVFDEQLALEGRAGYYDAAGALVDMIQSHLLLVLALVAMEPPSSIDADDLRGSMAQALRATRVQGGDATSASRHARYAAGTVEGRSLPAYADEPGVDPARGTETLAEVTLAVENWRWAGVPFVLRSGKALADTRKEIIVTFKEVPHLPDGLTGREEPSRLRISLSPDEIALDLTMNGEGNPFELDRVTLGAVFGEGQLGPYGEVLAGILSADPTLSVRADVTEQCWRIVAPILEAWSSGSVLLEEYPAGSTGPDGWE
ncbi:MAG: glucose-6-phosphate dehydrogenase [Burkholderiaceae bacterium]|nr:glucose-6-phosphate dehydrogenase [Microbacteriaceae bacterium]